MDEERSHLRVSYFLPRDPASPDRSAWQAFSPGTDELYEEDARMWRCTPGAKLSGRREDTPD